jgi:hypothetical protein
MDARMAPKYHPTSLSGGDRKALKVGRAENTFSIDLIEFDSMAAERARILSATW